MPTPDPSKRISLDNFRAERQEAWKEHAADRKFTGLVVGPVGCGKTTLLGTCRKPVLVHSFDPGGCSLATFREPIERGEIIVDSSFEVEDARAPTQYSRWKAEMDRILYGGLFEQVGTFAIDSLTMWSKAIMNRVVVQKGRADGIPQMRDYQEQMGEIFAQITKLCSLPCDFVCTAHLVYDKDETTGQTFAGPLVTGKLRETLPGQFSECYYLSVRQTSQGNERQLLTDDQGYYHARTRIGAGIFELYEKPDILYLLRKAGLEEAA